MSFLRSQRGLLLVYTPQCGFFRIGLGLYAFARGFRHRFFNCGFFCRHACGCLCLLRLCVRREKRGFLGLFANVCGIDEAFLGGNALRDGMCLFSGSLATRLGGNQQCLLAFQLGFYFVFQRAFRCRTRADGRKCLALGFGPLGSGSAGFTFRLTQCFGMLFGLAIQSALVGCSFNRGFVLRQCVLRGFARIDRCCEVLLLFAARFCQLGETCVAAFSRECRNLCRAFGRDAGLGGGAQFGLGLFAQRCLCQRLAFSLSALCSYGECVTLGVGARGSCLPRFGLELAFGFCLLRGIAIKLATIQRRFDGGLVLRQRLLDYFARSRCGGEFLLFLAARFCQFGETGIASFARHCSSLGFTFGNNAGFGSGG